MDAGAPTTSTTSAMHATRVAFTVVTGDSPDLGGEGFRMESGNSGTSWTKTASSLSAGDERQVAFATALGTSKLVEAWLRVDGQTYPSGLRYHRQS